MQTNPHEREQGHQTEAVVAVPETGSPPNTLQEARDNRYGLHTSRPVTESHQSIDYLKLKD